MYIQKGTGILQTSADGNVWDNTIQVSEIVNIEGSFQVVNPNGINPSLPLNITNYATITIHKTNKQAMVIDMNRPITNVSTGQTYTASLSDYETFLSWLNGLL